MRRALRRLPYAILFGLPYLAAYAAGAMLRGFQSGWFDGRELDLPEGE